MSGIALNKVAYTEDFSITMLKLRPFEIVISKFNIFLKNSGT